MESYSTCKWFEFNGITVKESNVFIESICSDTDDEPIFIEVKKILICPGIPGIQDVILICTLLKTIGFDFHYHAYEVFRTENIVCKRYLDLYSPVPNNLTIMPDSTLYVTLRSLIV